MMLKQDKPCFRCTFLLNFMFHSQSLVRSPLLSTGHVALFLLTLLFCNFMRANEADRLACVHTGKKPKHLDAPLRTDENRCFPKDVFFPT